MMSRSRKQGYAGRPKIEHFKFQRIMSTRRIFSPYRCVSAEKASQRVVRRCHCSKWRLNRWNFYSVISLKVDLGSSERLFANGNCAEKMMNIDIAHFTAVVPASRKKTHPPGSVNAFQLFTFAHRTTRRKSYNHYHLHSIRAHSITIYIRWDVYRRLFQSAYVKSNRP